MVVGKYVDGRELTYDQGTGQFAIGGIPVTASQVLAYDTYGQIQWPNNEVRWWARRLGEADSAPSTSVLRVQAGDQARVGWFTRLPVWAKILFVILWPVSIPYAVIVMWKDRRFTQPVRLVITLGVVIAFALSWSGGGLTDSNTSADAAKTASSGSTTSTSEPSTAKETSVQYDFGDMTDAGLIKNFTTACGEVGINPGKIKKVKKLPDWAGGERYSFVYETTGLEVYANADKTISSINIGDLHLYEQGLEPLQVSNYLVDVGTAMALQVASEKTVKSALSYPSTASFNWFDSWGVSRYGDIYVIGGQVDAKNALGVQSTLGFSVEYAKTGESYEPKYFVLDGKQVIGTHSVIPEVSREEIGAKSTGNEITLLEGTLGTYGKNVNVDGLDEIWYHIPTGTYAVSSQVKWCKVYLEKDKLVKNSSGFSEGVTVKTLEFDDTGNTQELTVSDGEHIFLTARAKVTFIPVR